MVGSCTPCLVQHCQPIIAGLAWQTLHGARDAPSVLPLPSLAVSQTAKKPQVKSPGLEGVLLSAASSVCWC